MSAKTPSHLGSGPKVRRYTQPVISLPTPFIFKNCQLYQVMCWMSTSLAVQCVSQDHRIFFPCSTELRSLPALGTLTGWPRASVCCARRPCVQPALCCGRLHPALSSALAPRGGLWDERRRGTGLQAFLSGVSLVIQWGTSFYTFMGYVSFTKFLFTSFIHLWET